MLPIKRRVKHLSPWQKKTSNQMKNAMMPIKRGVRYLSQWQSSNQRKNAMMPNKRGVRHLSPWPWHNPHPPWSGGLRNHVWWHHPYPWWNYPQLRNRFWWHRPFPWWNYPQHQWPIKRGVRHLSQWQSSNQRTNAMMPIKRGVRHLSPRPLSNQMKNAMMPIKRGVRQLSLLLPSNQMTNAMMPIKRGVRYLSPWPWHHPHPWSGGVRNHVWWHRPYPWWNYPQHQWPQPWTGPLACCRRVRIQSSGLTTSYRPGTYLHTQVSPIFSDLTHILFMITITYIGAFSVHIYIFLDTLGFYDRVQMRYGKPIYRKSNNPTYFLAHLGSYWRVVVRGSFNVQPYIRATSTTQCPYQTGAGNWWVNFGSWQWDRSLQVVCIA